MKYVIINDLSYFFRKKLKYFFAILIIIALYPVAERLVYFLKGFSTVYWYKTYASHILIKNIGASFDNSGLSNISFYIPLILYTYLIFQTISCYFNQLKYGPENIFLRLNKYKWLLCKYLSIFIYTIIFQIIVYTMLIIIYYFMGLKMDLDNILSIFLYDTIVKIYFCYFMILIVSWWNKFGVPLMYIFLFLGMLNIKILFFMRYLYAEVYLVNNKIYCALIIFLIITIITFIENKRQITYIFMKEE